MTSRQRYRGILAYDGTRYAGFQRQASGTLTIQSQLEETIAALTQQKITVLAAGRTDAGVHASGQVIAFNCKWTHSPTELWRAINANLPADIVLVNLSEAPMDFHPRYAALSRQYSYQFYTAEVRNPLWDRYRWHVGSHIDLVAMQSAAEMLIGSHDFGSFGQPTHGDVTIREVFQSFCQVQTNGSYVYIIEANAFLKHMVRRIMGTLVAVGRGQISLAEFASIFAAVDRRRAMKTAPPHGLTLEQVKYRGDITG